MLKGAIVFFLPVVLSAQTITGAGYTSPAPVSAAPGEILTLLVSGITVQGVRAPAGTLPATLGGVTVTLHQLDDTPIPIVQVQQVSTCPDTSQLPQTPPCGSLAAISVQFPYELIAQCPICATPVALVPAHLSVSANGQTGTSMELNSVTDRVHILTSCDLVMTTPLNALPPQALNGLPCAPMVTHGDGSLVSASKPASVGEALTAWAAGLGQTNPAAVTGQPASAAAPAVQTFYMNYNYTVNALPVKPFTGRPDVKPPQPLFAGLAAGFVGLYQINFVVPPQPPTGTPLCAPLGAYAPGSNPALSNLTVSVGGPASFDGAGICVATQIPVD